MPVLADGGNFLHRHFPHTENRLRVAHAEGLQRGEGLHRSQRKLVRLGQAVHRNGGLNLFLLQPAGGVVQQLPTKALYVFPPDGQARRQLVPSVFLQKRSAMLQGGVEIEAGNAAAGALALVAVQRNQHRRHAVTVGQAGSHNANDAVVPIFAPKSQSLVPLGVELSVQPACDLLENIIFLLLPSAIQLA